MGKALCINCGDFVYYKIKTSQEEKERIIKGEKIKYSDDIAYCVQCGKPLWVERVEQSNIEKPIELYCQKHGLITPKQIRDILDKYNIGKKPLAKLLGWGDVTIIRFLEGQIPSRPYSNELIRIYNDAEWFLKTVTENKKKITHIAYKKVYRAIKKYIENLRVLSGTLYSSEKCIKVKESEKMDYMISDSILVA